jgi:hypothetical protein
MEFSDTGDTPEVVPKEEGLGVMLSWCHGSNTPFRYVYSNLF